MRTGSPGHLAHRSKVPHRERVQGEAGGHEPFVVRDMRLDARSRHAEGITLPPVSVVANRPGLPEVSSPARGPVRRLSEEGTDRKGSLAMRQRQEEAVLFLCTGNYYRSRFAEVLFNAVASKMGLPWRASSRGLALERGVNNVGPMAVSAVKALETHGLRAVAEFGRFPIQATEEDFEKAEWIVALKETEHLPLLQERFPAWAGNVEFWQVDDAPEALALIERDIMDLTARLIVGGKRREEIPTETVAASAKKEVGKASAP